MMMGYRRGSQMGFLICVGVYNGLQQEFKYSPPPTGGSSRCNFHNGRKPDEVVDRVERNSKLGKEWPSGGLS